MNEAERILVDHLVEVSFLGAKPEEAEDGEVEAVDGADAAGLRVEDVGARWVADVLAEPHGAECLLEAVIVPAATLLSLPDLLLVMLLSLVLLGGPRHGAHQVQLCPLHSDDVVPVVVLALESPHCLRVHVERLFQVP